jgi:hypothetical protein
MVKYYDLGPDKRLNEIVMAGSHDAGILYGGGNAMTQALNISQQAEAGVRLFDLRVAGAGTKSFVEKQVELRTYHGSAKNKTFTRNVKGLHDGPQQVQKGLNYGVWGDSLQQILGHAVFFVDYNPTEFLILKFDKCKNWPQIAAQCVAELGDFLYKGSGNLNRKTLDDLKGKVIVVFTQGGLNAIEQRYHGTGGILGIKNLSSGGSYQENYNGLQYYGKGGTKMLTPKGKSTKENYRKQFSLMRDGSAGNPEVMGMMYWTTTGLVGNIKKRNNKMWQGGHRQEMVKLWQSGITDYFNMRVPLNIDPTSFAGGQTLKRFLPNIVMVDFADLDKCRTIYQLNDLIPTELTFYERLMVELRLETA